MNRNLLLILLALFGAAAVGLLLSLTGDDQPQRRGTGQGIGGSKSTASRDRGGRRPIDTFVVGPDGSRTGHRSPTVLPGARAPFDSPEMRDARQRYATRIVELLDEMIDPSLRFDQRRMKASELQRLLRLMGNRVSPAVRQQLLEMLTTVEPRWMSLVGDTIGSLEGDTETAAALCDMLAEKPSNIRTTHAIYAALGKMNVKEVTPVLMGMLGHGRSDEHLIIRTVGALAGREELDALFSMLDKPLRDPTRREIELVLVQKSQGAKLLDKAVDGLGDADAVKRRSLLKILSSSRDPAHAEKVRDLLVNESDPESRRLAIQALGKFGDAESGKLLLELAKSGSQTEQRRAVQAIHSIRSAETVDMLGGGWRGLDPMGRLAVMGAASRLTIPTPNLEKLARTDGLFDDDLRVRTSSARVLGRPGRDANVGTLVDFLDRAKHPTETAAALAALERIRTKKAAEEAMRALRAVSNEKQRASWMRRFQKIYEQATKRPPPVAPVAPVRRKARAGDNGK